MAKLVVGFRDFANASCTDELPGAGTAGLTAPTVSYPIQGC